MDNKKQTFLRATVDRKLKRTISWIKVIHKRKKRISFWNKFINLISISFSSFTGHAVCHYWLFIDKEIYSASESNTLGNEFLKIKIVRIICKPIQVKKNYWNYDKKQCSMKLFGMMDKTKYERSKIKFIFFILVFLTFYSQLSACLDKIAR